MKLSRLTNETAVAKAAAGWIAQTVTERPDANIVLPAGKTPVLMIKDLVRSTMRGELNLSRARFYQLDEYAGVEPADPRSFHSFIRRHLLERLDPDVAANARLLCGDETDLPRHIEAHARRLAAEGGAHLAILGLGLNGHVGFNEPGSERTARARVVELHASTLETAASDFDPAELPSRGITMGLAEILAAQRIIVLVTGGGKAQVLRDLFERPASSDLPASWLRDHPQCFVLADRAACSLLKSLAAAE